MAQDSGNGFYFCRASPSLYMKIRRFKIFLIVILILVAVFYVLSLRPIPKTIVYGASFSKFHSDELGLNWKKVYLALLDDLKIHNLRLSAHWPMIEPVDGKYNFSELDFQMKEAQKRNTSVILAVGRRLPGWPECHIPDWAQKLSREDRNQRILGTIETTINRYKGFNNIKYWQVENEAFLTFFSRSVCGALDEDFLKKEVSLVHKLDPTRPVLLTDSGEFGYWYSAYRDGDIFGTSIYLYIWWRHGVGPFRYPITPAFFRIKQSIVQLLNGGTKKPSFVIELSAEPWLLQPIPDTPMEVLLQRMGIDKFNEMINFSSKTGFDTIYLWGAEWWYWMREHGHPEFWNRAKELFAPARLRAGISSFYSPFRFSNG